MKKLTLMVLLFSAAISTQAAQFDLSELNISVFGVLITPTHNATVGLLSEDPWWHNSDLAHDWAIGYASALFNWAKYNDPSLADGGAPLVYFAYDAQDNNYVSTWVYDIGRNTFYNETGNSIHLLLGVDPPIGGRQSVPDCASTAGLMVLALGGIAAGRKVVA